MVIVWKWEGALATDLAEPLTPLCHGSGGTINSLSAISYIHLLKGGVLRPEPELLDNRKCHFLLYSEHLNFLLF